MILHIVGARPNYVKAAPLIRELGWSKQLVVNTSQHYSDNMSKDIMRSIGMRSPDIHLPAIKDSPINRLSSMIENLYSVIKENPIKDIKDSVSQLIKSNLGVLMISEIDEY